jgi:hypothetical protein
LQVVISEGAEARLQREQELKAAEEARIFEEFKKAQELKDEEERKRQLLVRNSPLYPHPNPSTLHNANPTPDRQGKATGSGVGCNSPLALFLKFARFSPIPSTTTILLLVICLMVNLETLCSAKP